MRLQLNHELSCCETAWAEKKYYSPLQTAPRLSAVMFLIVTEQFQALWVYFRLSDSVEGRGGAQGGAVLHRMSRVAKDTVTHKKRSPLFWPDCISSGNIKTTGRPEEQ